MTYAPFTAKRADGRALWRVAADTVADWMEHGQIVDGQILSHERLVHALEIDTVSPSYYQAMSRAAQELQQKYNCTLASVRGVGYRLAKGMDQISKGVAVQEQSRRKMDSALNIITSVDENDLRPGEVKMYRKIREGMGFMSQVLAATYDDVQATKQDIAMLKEGRLEDRMRQLATEDQMEQMRQKIAELDGELRQRRDRDIHEADWR